MRLWMVAALGLAVGCAGGERVVRRVPGPPAGSAGSLEISLTRKTSNLSVAINGALVVDHVEGERIRIDGIETGYADVAIAGDGVERQLRVWIDHQRVTSIPVAIDAPRQTSP